MSMSAQDFIALADKIKYLKGTPDEFTPKQLDVIMDFCRGQNYRFKPGRFQSYIAGECGPRGGEIKTKKAA